MLERAVGAGVIQETGGAAGHYTFAHALIRESLYTRLTMTRRALLHRRVATALEQAHAGKLDEYRADLAHHFARAGSAADLSKAIDCETLAGVHAISLLAYEQAAAHFRQAATLLDSVAEPGKTAQRCELLIAQGQAQLRAGDPDYRETLLRAAAIARQVGDAGLLTRAALANNLGIFSSVQAVDRERVDVLMAALGVQDAGDSPMHAALLANLAVELIAGPDWRDRERLADEALAMARRAGDAATLADVLNKHSITVQGPRSLPQRLTQTAEAARLADEIGDPALASRAAMIGVPAALEVGDLPLAGRLLDRCEQLAEQLGIPDRCWHAKAARVKLVLATGSPQQAERLAFDALAAGQQIGQPDAFAWFMGQIIVARTLAGSLGSGEPNLAELVEFPFPLPVGPALTQSASIWLQVEVAKSITFCELGRMPDGRRHFEAAMANDLHDLPHDYAELAILAYASLACAHLDDHARAARLRTLIEPYADHFVDTGPSWLGAARHYVALLAATLGELDEADGQFAMTARAYERIGAPAWLVRAHTDWAKVLRARAGKGDLDRAADLLRHASRGAEQLGLERVQSHIAAL